MHLKFSQDLESLLKQLASHPLTLKDILSETSERGFSLIIGFFVIPFLIPMPPGLAGVFGAACLLLSLQMAFGRHEPWLPRKIAHFKFPRGFSLTLLKQLKGLTRLLEKITRPRLLRVANNRYIWRINGLCMAWLAVLLMLPVPLTNFLPSSGILLLAVATLEADGLLMCVGYVWTVLVTLLFAFIGYALWQAHQLFR
jgi:hypothetical protein